MFSLLPRLSALLTIIIILLVLLMQVVGKLIPLEQIIPVVTYNSSAILLIDSSRHIGASLRAYPGVIFDAAVSPDQQHIAFSMSSNRQIHIFIGNLYAGDYQQLTPETMGGNSPAWSPDGRQIVFVGFERDNKRGIYTISADGDSTVQTIVKAGVYNNPSWSSDGQQLIFAASRYRDDLQNLFVVEANCRMRCDREMLQITDELVDDTSPIWSPDMSKIAFLSDRLGAYEIYTLDGECLQTARPQCSSQTPQRLHLNNPIVPFFILWSLDTHEVYFRAWDLVRNQQGIYAVQADCFSLSEGCQPRMIYNLMSPLRDITN
ncbi:MAG: hypothetical protein GC179_10710 [Anaerolineaceae bacterium]|nr:hypothetical protein [Anaerolineaceae bacterium]